MKKPSCGWLDIRRKVGYNIGEVREMEKALVEIGFGITFVCFMGMVLIGSDFLWGTLIGLAITGFGWFFWEEY